MSRVSIIVRTIEMKWPLLQVALQSIVEQTYKDIEILVVEDGSNKLKAKLDAIRDKNPNRLIRYIPIEKSGRSAAANAGLENAKGEFIGFLDDDDWLHKSHCEVLVGLLRKYPGASGAYAASEEVSADLDSKKMLFMKATERKIFYCPTPTSTKFIAQNLFPIQAVLFRSSILCDGDRFDTNLDALEDWLFWLRLFIGRQLVSTPQVTSTFFVPSSKKERKKREQAHVDAEYYFNIQRNAFFEAIRIKDLSLFNQYYESELQNACLEVLDRSDQTSANQLTDQTIKHQSSGSTLELRQPALKIRQKIRQVLELDDVPNIEPKPGQSTVVFTSINLRYLPKALVLAKSFKKHHPDWMFHILLNDALPDQPKTLPNVDVIYPIRGLNIENFHSWCFRHDVVELCTATKPFYVKQLLGKGWENVFYFDPDIKIFQSLDLLTNQLESSNVLLTPHCTEQAKSLTEIHYNEISCLAHGIYNLGFAGFKNTKTGIDVANFWARRMLRYCLDDHARGLFTDQKWINHVPVFFDNVCILKHKGCNTASWNIASRPISRRNGQVYAGDDPLLFFHFSGYDKNVPRRMFDIYGRFNAILDELITEYDTETTSFSEKYKIWKNKWALACFDDGNIIEQQVRRFYRENHEMELIFTAPFYARTTPSFSQWLQNHGHEQIAKAAPPTGFIRQFY